MHGRQIPKARPVVSVVFILRFVPRLLLLFLLVAFILFRERREQFPSPPLHFFVDGRRRRVRRILLVPLRLPDRLLPQTAPALPVLQAELAVRLLAEHRRVIDVDVDVVRLRPRDQVNVVVIRALYRRRRLRLRPVVNGDRRYRRLRTVRRARLRHVLSRTSLFLDRCDFMLIFVRRYIILRPPLRPAERIVSYYVTRSHV